MNSLDKFEEEIIIPVIVVELRERPDGITLDDIKTKLFHRGIVKTRERLLMICAVLEVSGFCTMRRSGDDLRYIPNTELYSSPAIIH